MFLGKALDNIKKEPGKKCDNKKATENCDRRGTIVIIKKDSGEDFNIKKWTRRVVW